MSNPSPLQIAQAQAKIRELEEQFAVMQQSLTELKRMFSSEPKAVEPPNNDELGIGNPTPKVRTKRDR